MAGANLIGSAKETVLILGDGARARQLKEQLTAEGYDVVGTAATGAAAAKLFASKQPQVLVIHLAPGHLGASAAVSAMLGQRMCPVIAVADEASPPLVEAACAACACGYLTGAVSGAALAAQIQVSISRFNAFDRLSREKAQIAQDLEARKYVDRAKAVLMRKVGLTEPQAHRKLQQESQRRRLGIGEVARRIVEADEMLGEGS